MGTNVGGRGRWVLGLVEEECTRTLLENYGSIDTAVCWVRDQQARLHWGHLLRAFPYHCVSIGAKHGNQRTIDAASFLARHHGQASITRQRHHTQSKCHRHPSLRSAVRSQRSSSGRFHARSVPVRMGEAFPPSLFMQMFLRACWDSWPEIPTIPLKVRNRWLRAGGKSRRTLMRTPRYEGWDRITDAAPTRDFPRG